MKKSFFIANAFAAALIGAGAFSVSAFAKEGTLHDGIYTAEQSEAGKPLFVQNCSTCHNADFYKVTLNGYQGQPLIYLFESIMASMPADKPGALMDNEYEDIMAHILEIIGFPAGEERLTYTGDTMRNTKIVTAP
jgi:cytochrome c553